MAKRRGETESHPDHENPEWTAQDFTRARPALDMVSEVFGAKSAEAIRGLPARPSKPDRKINQTLRLDADVLAAYRDLGVGWQVRINRVLRENMPIAKAEASTRYRGSAPHVGKRLSSMNERDNGQLFIERRPQGDYAVRRPGSERASDVLPTQKEAIVRARELSPSATPMVERVRNVSTGNPDKWRKP